jgi:hypothetical protein
MPLIHSSSDKARQENIETELKAHPDMNPKQAVAIGYSVQRQSSHEDKKAHEMQRYGRSHSY